MVILTIRPPRIGARWRSQLLRRHLWPVATVVRELHTGGRTARPVSKVGARTEFLDSHGGHSDRVESPVSFRRPGAGPGHPRAIGIDWPGDTASAVTHR